MFTKVVTLVANLPVMVCVPSDYAAPTKKTVHVISHLTSFDMSVLTLVIVEELSKICS